MIRYVIRRLLWGVALLIIVAAVTFVLFRVLPTGNPAVLRAGRDPQPRLIKEIEAVLGLNKPLIVQFWDYMKEVFLHFNLGYSYYSSGVRQEPDRRTPAGDPVADGRRRRAVDRGRAERGHRLGAAPALRLRPRGDGHLARARSPRPNSGSA